MDLSGLAALITAVIGAAGAVYGLMRRSHVAKLAKSAEVAADHLAHYERLFGSYRQTVTDLEDEVRRLRERHEQDYEKWLAEKERLQERIDELEGQVTALQFRIQGGFEAIPSLGQEDE